MIILGIDPGKKGSFCALNTQSKTVAFMPMPLLYDMILDHKAILKFLTTTKPDITFLEKVSGRHGWGATQSFNFGCLWGQCVMAAASCDLPLKMITPQSWQKIAHAGCKSAATPKERSWEAINQLWPDHGLKKSQDGNIDAFLIAWAAQWSLAKTTEKHITINSKYKRQNDHDNL